MGFVARLEYRVGGECTDAVLKWGQRHPICAVYGGPTIACRAAVENIVLLVKITNIEEPYVTHPAAQERASHRYHG